MAAEGVWNYCAFGVVTRRFPSHLGADGRGLDDAVTPGMVGVRDFRQLACWQLAYELKLRVYAVARRPAVRRDAKLHGQLIETARSGPRNIAEGFARRSHADFARFLDVARASLTEIQNHLQDGVDCGYYGQQECDEVVILAKRACGAIAALQRYLRGGA